MSKKAIFIVVSLVVVGAVVFAGLSLYGTITRSCVAEDTVLYVPSGATYSQLIDTLTAHLDTKSVDRIGKVGKVKGLEKSFRGGRYLIKKGSSARTIVGMFQAGLQSPVRLTFNNMRTLPQLAGRLAAQIEPDSITMLEWLTSSQAAERYGFNTQEMIGMFMPDTYEVWWTLTPEQLTDRMKSEYDRFWSEERDEKLQRTSLTRKQVVTLASIVYEETKMSDEMPLVAGVYINRLRAGIPLQADPTVKFAIGDFALRRILKSHLSVDSPYNTYINRGLPPAPICMPSKKAVDSVLDYREHNYLYFCAKEDFSGYHNFAATLAEHNRNAQRYQAALNRAGIR